MPRAIFGIYCKDSWGVLEKEGKKRGLKWCRIAKADTFHSQGKGTIWCEGLTEVGMEEDTAHKF